MIIYWEAVGVCIPMHLLTGNCELNPEDRGRHVLAFLLEENTKGLNRMLKPSLDYSLEAIYLVNSVFDALCSEK